MLCCDRRWFAALRVVAFVYSACDAAYTAADNKFFRKPILLTWRPPMRAEAQKSVEQIKEALALLRRSL